MVLDKQTVQDDAYNFPYHYIAQYKPGFCQTFNDAWGICYISTIEFLLDNLKKEDFHSIVDIGTGDGRLVKELASVFQNKQVVGIDYSIKAINLAKALNPELDFRCIDIINQTKTIAVEKFDAITLIEVLEHIPLNLVVDFIKSMVGMLKDNGFVYITVPHINRIMDDRHFQHFTIEKLKYYFGAYFKFEEIIHFEQEEGLLIRIIHKCLTNKFFILNHTGVLNYFYKQYKKKYFFASENNCRRIFVKMRIKRLE